jgi:hypothetical protein
MVDRHFSALVVVEFKDVLLAQNLRPERRRWQNKYAVSFVNETARLYVEGVHWGGSARAAVGSSRAEFENYDLLDVVHVSSPELLPTAQDQGQREALRRLATLAAQCAAIGRILSGDFSLFPAMDRVREARSQASMRALFGRDAQDPG